jgi:hypothetical protein
MGKDMSTCGKQPNLHHSHYSFFYIIPQGPNLIYKAESLFVCLFVCDLYKSTFLNQSEPNFAHLPLGLEETVRYV